MQNVQPEKSLPLKSSMRFVGTMTVWAAGAEQTSTHTHIKTSNNALATVIFMHLGWRRFLRKSSAPSIRNHPFATPACSSVSFHRAQVEDFDVAQLLIFLSHFALLTYAGKASGPSTWPIVFSVSARTVARAAARASGVRD
jgi:hypothetical protein